MVVIHAFEACRYHQTDHDGEQMVWDCWDGKGVFKDQRYRVRCGRLYSRRFPVLLRVFLLFLHVGRNRGQLIGEVHGRELRDLVFAGGVHTEQSKHFAMCIS